MDNIEKINLDNVDWKSSKEFFDSLLELANLENSSNERYLMTWVGRKKSIVEAGAPINKTLRPDRDESVNFDSTKNLCIVGDNLDALKILQESYLGEVKMIYIDPPYNTGNDFVYKDSFSTNKDNYKSNYLDEDGNVLLSEDKMIENERTNGRFHSDWLSMIYPRLKLCKNLLSEDGIIFISIDDNELDNLRKVCEEIFGEENFGGIAPRKTRGSATTKGDSEMQKINDYLVIFFKDKKTGTFNQKIVGEKKYPYSDERGDYYIVPLQDNGPHGTREARPNLWYPIYVLENGDLSYEEPSSYKEKVLPAMHQNKEGRWMWSKKKFDTDKKDLLIKDGKAWIKHYYVEGEDQNKYQREKLWIDDCQNAKGTIALNALFPEIKNVFSNPKPLELIDFCLNAGAEKDSIILDFFGGSGSTAHAVMEKNAADGGTRRYITVQLNEDLDENYEHATGSDKANIKNTIDFLESINKKHEISEVTIERLRRAGEKIHKENPDADVDTGFRVLRIDDSNEKANIRKPAGDFDQTTLLDSIDNLKPERTPLDLLFGSIVVSALPLDLKLEERDIDNNHIYLYGYEFEKTGLIACFDEDISEDTIKAIANLQPNVAIFRESSFDRSDIKINLSEHFRLISPDTKVKVL